MKLQTGESAH